MGLDKAAPEIKTDVESHSTYEYKGLSTFFLCRTPDTLTNKFSTPVTYSSAWSDRVLAESGTIISYEYVRVAAANIFILVSFERRSSLRTVRGARYGRGKIEHSPEELVCTECEIGYFLTVLYSCMSAWKCRTRLTYVSHIFMHACAYAHSSRVSPLSLSLSSSLSLCLYSFLCFAISLHPLLSGPRVVVTRNSNLSFRRRWKSCGTWRRELTR